MNHDVHDFCYFADCDLFDVVGCGERRACSQSHGSLREKCQGPESWSVSYSRLPRNLLASYAKLVSSPPGGIRRYYCSRLDRREHLLS